MSAQLAGIRSKAKLRLCDFRRGCALINDVFPDRPEFAREVITSSPHLAEALYRSGLIVNGKAAVDMALAMQEARTCPPSGCDCRIVSKPIPMAESERASNPL